MQSVAPVELLWQLTQEQKDVCWGCDAMPRPVFEPSLKHCLWQDHQHVDEPVYQFNAAYIGVPQEDILFFNENIAKGTTDPGVDCFDQ